MLFQPASRDTGNLFLDHLPVAAYASLFSSLSRVALKSGEVVYEPGERFARVLFPIASIVSLVLDMSDGGTAEVGIVGRDGMTGLPIVLGQERSNLRGIVQVPDSAYCLGAADFRATLDRTPELQQFSLRYAQAAMTCSAHLSACNSLHSTNERCARWLLMAHDRVDGDRIRLTQEFLSQMLGVRRTGVTAAASVLQAAGFISYSRGVIVVIDRAGLETASCECYAATENASQAIVGYSSRKICAGTEAEIA